MKHIYYFHVCRNTKSQIMKGEYLGEFEELVLLIVAVHHGKAYGVGIMETLKDEIGRKATISAIHAVLSRMEKKGFVKSYMGEAGNERGGRRKRIFEITSYGAKSLEESKDARASLFNKVPQIVFTK